MNKSTVKLTLELAFTIVAVLVLAASIFWREQRIFLFIAGGCLLIFCWFLEATLWRSRKPPVAGRQTYAFGSFEVSGKLLVGDGALVTEIRTLEPLPTGHYSAVLETIAADDGVYVSRVCLTANANTSDRPYRETRVTVDSGFLTFCGVDLTEEVRRELSVLPSRILSQRARLVDAELLQIRGQNVGLVTATGFGDDQYLVLLDADEHGRPRISCQFIDASEIQEMLDRTATRAATYRLRR